MVTQEIKNAPTKKRFFDNLLGRNNEQKDEKESLPTQTAQSRELVLKAKNVYETVPEELTDTIFTSELFVEPILTKHGHVFEKQHLLTWLKLKPKCPKTNNPLTLLDMECQTQDDIVIQNDINSIIQEYTTARASFLRLITNGKVTENDILAYQATITRAVDDFQQVKQSMFDAEIEAQLTNSYNGSCFPLTIESFDEFCLQVSVLSEYNEWIPKSCASSYTEHKNITDDLWKLNNKLIQLNIAIANKPSHQLQTTISQLHEEYQRILGNMQSIKQQSQISARRDLDEYHGGPYLLDGSSAPLHEYSIFDQYPFKIDPISTEQCLRFSDNSAPDANRNRKDEAPVEDNMNDAVSQSPKCTCSLFLKMISAVASANGILLLIVLHTPVGFAAGITSLCVGGLTLFAASREKKHDVQAPAAAYLTP